MPSNSSKSAFVLLLVLGSRPKQNFLSIDGRLMNTSLGWSKYSIFIRISRQRYDECHSDKFVFLKKKPVDIVVTFTRFFLLGSATDSPVLFLVLFIFDRKNFIPIFYQNFLKSRKILFLRLSLIADMF